MSALLFHLWPSCVHKRPSRTRGGDRAIMGDRDDVVCEEHEEPRCRNSTEFVTPESRLDLIELQNDAPRPLRDVGIPRKMGSARSLKRTAPLEKSTTQFFSYQPARAVSLSGNRSRCRGIAVARCLCGWGDNRNLRES